MDGIYQKLYSAISSLSNVSKENSFIDNIASIDTFLSELRNITFMIQKKYTDENGKEVYNRLNDKYLRNDSIMKQLIELRNETTKEHPFDLIINIECIVYLSKKIKFNILTLRLKDKKISVNNIENKVKNYLKTLKCDAREIYFSYDCNFISDGKSIDIIEYAKHGIETIYKFLLEFEKEIYGNTDEYDGIKKFIVEKLKKVFINKMDLNTNCEYLRDTDKIETSSKVRIFGISNDNELMENYGRIPLNKDQFLLKGNSQQERFKSFILCHIALAKVSEQLMTTFITIYRDNTYTIDTFPVFNKAELYYTIDKFSAKIKTENIDAIFCLQELICATENLEKFSQMTHDEKMANYNKDFLSFSMVTGKENIFIVFDRDRISDVQYVKEILGDLKSNFNNSILLPLVQAFKKDS